MEELYHYLWQYKLFGRRLNLTNGSSLEIINPGRQNHDSGPDFFNAQIKINDIHWAGNVEIHTKASDWYRHGHQNDNAYETIILHVVGISDRHVNRSDGSEIPQLEVTMPESFFHTYYQLSNNNMVVKCAEKLSSLTGLAVCDWLSTLAIERLQKKAARIYSTLEFTGMDWEQACFVTLARSLGFGLNGEPFEQLARNLPLKILHHHCDNLFQIEALLFGQAGMLDSSVNLLDEYYQSLANEYYFLARKYGLRSMSPTSWKMSRTRPGNFPQRRIAMLANACYGGFKLLGEILSNSEDVEKLRDLFSWKVSDYWHSHSQFGVEGRTDMIEMSASSHNLLLINFVAPLCYAYGSVHGDPDLCERAQTIIEGLKAEQNSIIRQWRSYGIEIDDAMQSQAILQLQKEYCEAGKCFRCRFGYALLSRDARR